MTVNNRVPLTSTSSSVLKFGVVALAILLPLFLQAPAPTGVSPCDVPRIERFDLVHRSDLVTRSPISIAGDAQLDTFCAGNGTNGTILHPYVISGFHIDASSSPYAIQLVDTTRFVILEGNAFGNNTLPSGNILNSAGVFLINVSNVVVANNTFQRNFNGITILSSNSVTIINNSIIDSIACGLGINDSSSINASSNAFSNCGFFIDAATLPQLLSYNIDTTNKVNTYGSVYYLKNVHHMKVDHVQDGSQVFLVNCTSVEVSGIHFSSSTIGMLAYYSAEITVRSNTFETHNIVGIGGAKSQNLSIHHNRVSGSAFYGIGINTCNQTDIEYNVVFNNKADGIVVGGGSQTRISRNVLYDNPQYSIKVVNSNNTSINRNNVTNGNRGIALAWDDINATITGNLVSFAKDYAIGMELSTGINVSSNQLSSNKVGLKVDQFIENLSVFLNNFINSTTSHVIMETITNTMWNCTGWGNYWDDYVVHFPNATVAGNRTWMTPYLCNWTTDNFTDYHPLVSPNIIPWIEFQVPTCQWKVGIAVPFTFTGSPGDEPIAVRWVFGDGQQDTSDLTVQHAYSQPGHYSVSLFIRDLHGETDYVLLEDFIEVTSADDGGLKLLGLVISLGVAIGIPAMLIWIGVVRRRKERMFLQDSEVQLREEP